MIFAIDCGNTRLKWARFEVGRRTGRGHAPLHGADSPYALLTDALPTDAGRVLVANVAGRGVAEAIESAVTGKTGRDPEFVSVAACAHGIECAYRHPETLGVDRWLAMVAVRRELEGAFVVISAGTLVTFDAVDASGRHLGGLIVPSDRLMIESMAQKAEQIAVVDADVPAGLPDVGVGRSTSEAVYFGARSAVVGAIDRAYAAVKAELRAPIATVVTGGDGATVAAWLGTEVDLKEDLVLDGLAVVAGEHD